MNVSGHWIGAPEQARFCSFNGYMTQVFVIQTDYWVLLIAVYTFVVLTDNKKWSAWLHERALLPWAAPWVPSVLWASIGLGVVGYGDIGGWCWFTSDEVRLLVNFVPRCKSSRFDPVSDRLVNRSKGPSSGSCSSCTLGCIWFSSRPTVGWFRWMLPTRTMVPEAPVHVSSDQPSTALAIRDD
jgi:hypothetical protein